MIFNAESRALVREAERRWMPKFIIRVLTLLVGIIALCLAIATYVKTLIIIGLLVPLVLSIMWNLANITVRIRRARPLHPGANVACDLILWLLFIAFIGTSFSLSIYYYESSTPDFGFNFADCDLAYTAGDPSCTQTPEQRAEDASLAKIAITAVVFACIATIFHITLFIWACIDTHHRNKESADGRATLIAASMVQQMRSNGDCETGNSAGPRMSQFPPGSYVPYPGPQDMNQQYPQGQNMQYPQGSMLAGEPRGRSAYDDYSGGANTEQDDPLPAEQTAPRSKSRSSGGEGNARAVDEASGSGPGPLAMGMERQSLEAIEQAYASDPRSR